MLDTHLTSRKARLDDMLIGDLDDARKAVLVASRSPQLTAREDAVLTATLNQISAIIRHRKAVP